MVGVDTWSIYGFLTENDWGHTAILVSSTITDIMQAVPVTFYGHFKLRWGT
jgi:hypothetical protein